MRFLVDTNLPPSLAAWIVSQGHEAIHTIEAGLATAPDREIWSFASSIAATIVTKDEDFVILNAAQPDGPSVVWIRIGNAVRRVLIQRFEVAWPAVMEKLSNGECVIEVR